MTTKYTTQSEEERSTSFHFQVFLEKSIFSTFLKLKVAATASCFKVLDF